MALRQLHALAGVKRKLGQRCTIMGQQCLAVVSTKHICMLGFSCPQPLAWPGAGVALEPSLRLPLLLAVALSRPSVSATVSLMALCSCSASASKLFSRPPFLSPRACCHLPCPTRPVKGMEFCKGVSAKTKLLKLYLGIAFSARVMHCN